MDNLKKVLEDVIGKFVCDDAGIYKGQCPQLVRYFLIKCGVEWPGRTGNGNQVVDTLVREYGGYYGQSSRGYRICSADVKGSSDGHCWIELNINGQWYVYEQNSPNAGTKTANFGCGTVYSVSKATDRPAGIYNIRYAGHPSIDLVVDVNKPQPTPEPTPEPTPAPVTDDMPQWFKDWAKGLADYINSSTKEAK